MKLSALSRALVIGEKPMLIPFSPTTTQRGLDAMANEEAEIRRELNDINRSISELTTEVRDLRVSVHGMPDLNITGAEKRIQELECKQQELQERLVRMEAERDGVKSWAKGATWSMGILATLLAVGGTVSLSNVIRLLSQIAEGLP